MLLFQLDSLAATAAIILMSPVTSRDSKNMFCRTYLLTAQEPRLEYEVCIPPDLNLHVGGGRAIVLLTCRIGFSDNGEID